MKSFSGFFMRPLLRSAKAFVFSTLIILSYIEEVAK